MLYALGGAALVSGTLAWVFLDVASQYVMRKVIHRIGLMEPTWTLQSRWSLRKAWFIVRQGHLTLWFADIMNIGGYFVPSFSKEHRFDEMVIQVSWTCRPWVKVTIRHCEITLVTQAKAEWGGGKQLLLDWIAGYSDWVLDWLTRHLDVCCGLPRAAIRWHEDLGSPMRRLVVEVLGHMEASIDVLSMCAPPQAAAGCPCAQSTGSVASGGFAAGGSIPFERDRPPPLPCPPPPN